MTEELKQKAREYLRKHSKYSKVFNQTFISVDTLTAMVEFTTEATKELNKKLSQAEKDYDKMFWQKNEIISNLQEQIEELKDDNKACKFAMAMSEEAEKAKDKEVIVT